MNKYAGFLLAVVIGLGAVALAQTSFQSETIARNHTRACIPESGHSTQLSISGTSAATGALGANQVFSLLCSTDVYWEVGDAAAATADSNANWLPKEMLLYFSTGTGSTSRYISAIQVSAAGTCYISACK